MSKYYQPSGTFSPVSFLYFLLVSFIILPIVAMAYIYLVWYIPIIYVNFLVTLGFGFAVGYVISRFVVEMGKVRSPKVAIIFGLLGGVVVLYFSWAIWVDLVINAGESYGNSRIGITTSASKFSQILQLALQPNVLFDLITEINEYGTWGLRSATVSGTLLTIIWIIEALIVLVISFLLPYSKSFAPFCEMDSKWFDEQTLPAFNFIENTNEMTAHLESANQNSFETLQRASNAEKESHSIFTLYSSEKGENFLSIENKLAETNNKGEIDFNDNEFVEYISINRELRDILLKK